MGLDLRLVISASIKSTIAVILSPSSSRYEYDLQKPRYDFRFFARNEITDFLIFLHGLTRLACRGLVTMMISYTFQQ